nr:histidinol dehydrogenase [Burkholderiales bacterium]
MTPVIRRLASRAPGFAAELSRLLAYQSEDDDRIETAVGEILTRVKNEGDAALLDYTRRFDRLQARSVADLELPCSRLESALAGLA